ncbi:hypothetical protein O181_009593 [Austropuccinia psidii MF-1]|uniref:Sugar phosphate transporter domain-containing protein n=1 Tax=Austropuccinia psidii MF-1 TaxID=1389203 RepID=A0A9Q3BRC9_9BASI|nr:hypothetical protein [Austropuccinia psidii MF-1]
MSKLSSSPSIFTHFNQSDDETISTALSSPTRQLLPNSILIPSRNNNSNINNDSSSNSDSNKLSFQLKRIPSQTSLHSTSSLRSSPSSSSKSSPTLPSSSSPFSNSILNQNQSIFQQINPHVTFSNQSSLSPPKIRKLYSRQINHPKNIKNSSALKSLIISKLDTPSAWLIYYFAFNLGLTIYNKRVLIAFPFPWTLTAIHTLSGTIGSKLAHANKLFSAARLSRNHTLTLVAFSVLYTVNIAVSNLSLHLVTVPFHQVVRATTPLFTIILSIGCFGKTYSAETYASLIIVVLGVGLSTYGDYGWTASGLFLTLLGTILASLKTVVTNAIQVGRLRLNPLDLLMRMSPLAFIQCVIYAYLTGEMQRVTEYASQEMDRRKAIGLMMNGMIAFGLNVVSFTANKKTSALTMTVAANVKQVLTILLAIVVFDLVITPTNLMGILLTLIGGAYYGKIEFNQYQGNLIKSKEERMLITIEKGSGELKNIEMKKFLKSDEKDSLTVSPIVTHLITPFKGKT